MTYDYSHDADNVTPDFEMKYYVDYVRKGKERKKEKEKDKKQK